jgi:acylpyruvate hydrolase
MKQIHVKGTSEAIPAGNIFCLGRNYVAHAKELGNQVPDEPVIFLKPTSCLIREGSDIVLPRSSGNVHEELELGIVISKEGKDIPTGKAYEHVMGYLVLLDITARDIQDKAKARSLPWAVSKGYDTFGPISDMVMKDAVANPQDLELKLWVNGELRQDANTSLMIFKIDLLISYISTIFTLGRGDIIATGTPAGVSQIRSGDVLRGYIQCVGDVTFSVR